MTQSTNLKFDLVMHNQAHKEITVNEALIKIDMLMNNCVLELQCNTPIKEVFSGDMYIIGPEPTIQEWEKQKGLCNILLHQSMVLHTTKHWFNVMDKKIKIIFTLTAIISGFLVTQIHTYHQMYKPITHN
ncbi:MAG: DUF2793 domain-containing protein [Ehrlichia sp.]